MTWIHLLRQDVDSIIRAGEYARHVGCPPSAELLAPLALAYAQKGLWEKAIPLVKNAQRDPRRIFYLLSIAIVAREQNDTALEALLSKGNEKGNRNDVLSDAASILLKSNDPESVEWLRTKLRTP